MKTSVEQKFRLSIKLVKLQSHRIASTETLFALSVFTYFVTVTEKIFNGRIVSKFQF